MNRRRMLRALLGSVCAGLIAFGGTMLPKPAAAAIHGSVPPVGATYYLSPTGNDGNSGLDAAHPWLTHNHAVNCGDIIHVAASTAYTSSNVANGKWGVVSNCPSAGGVYFALSLCDGPSVESCFVNDTTAQGMRVDASNWAVEGWTASSTVGACFFATPSSAANIHHIAFINDYAKGCLNNGISSAPYFANTAFGVDYFAVVGAIAYNGAAGGSECYSGFSVYEPKVWDSASGTHIYTAGLFGLNNVDPASGCPGNSDGEGIIFDDWASQQTTGIAYTHQGVIEQSLFLGNGSAAVELFSSTSAAMSVTNVTGYGDYQSTVHTGTYNGEGLLSSAQHTTWTNNLFQASLQTQNGNAVYGFLVGTGVYNADGTNSVSGNYLFGVGGNNTSNQGTGFSFGSNTTATPNFVNPIVPSSAPDCSAAANVVACMSTVIANFTAQAVGAAGKGYQPPGACTPNANYPGWLKGIVPAGLITKPCGL